MTTDSGKVVLDIPRNRNGTFDSLLIAKYQRRFTVQDILIAVVDGLKGFPQAIEAAFPQTRNQTCIVHLLRHSMNFASYKDRKTVAAALKAIYTAVDADAAELALAEFEESDLASRYPAIAPSWRRAWNEVIPFLDYPPEVRRLVYTTNSIEALNSKSRRAVRTRGHFPSDDAAAKDNAPRGGVGGRARSHWHSAARGRACGHRVSS